MLHTNKNSFFKPGGQKLLGFAKQPKLYNWNFRSNNLDSLFFKANIITSKKLSNLQIKRFAQGFANTYEKKINKNGRTNLRQKAERLSGEIFKESFIDILHTNFEQVAFSPPLEGYFFGEKPLQFTKTIERKANVDFSTEKIGPTESKITRDHTNRRLSKGANLQLAHGLRSKQSGSFFCKKSFGKKVRSFAFSTPFEGNFFFPLFILESFASPKGGAYLSFEGGLRMQIFLQSSALYLQAHKVRKSSYKAQLCTCKRTNKATLCTKVYRREIYEKAKLEALLLQKVKKPRESTEHRSVNKKYVSRISFAKQILLKKEEAEQKLFKSFVAKPIYTREHNFGFTFKKNFNLKYKSQFKRIPIILNKKIGDYLSSGDKIGSFLLNKDFTSFPSSISEDSGSFRSFLPFLRKGYVYKYKAPLCKNICNALGPCKSPICNPYLPVPLLAPTGHGKGTASRGCKSEICTGREEQKEGRKSVEKAKEKAHPIILNCSGRILTISKTQLVLQKTQPVLFYNSANLHVKKGEWVKEGSPILTLTHQTLITGDIVQGIPRIEQLFEAFTSPPSAFKDRERSVTKFQNVHDTLHSRVRDIFRKHWFKSILPIAVRKSLEEIQYILVESIQKVYLSQGVLIADKHIEIIIRQIASKGQILDSGTTGLFLEEILPIRQIENANLVTPGKKCLYVPAVVGLTAAALSSDSFISAASFQETTRVLSRDAFVGKSDFLRGLKEKVVIGDLISAGTGLDIYFIYTTMMAR